MAVPVRWPIHCPMKPTANRRIAAAIATKMSLKPVMSLNCSSSGVGKARCPSTKSRNAAAVSGLIAPAATASSISFWLYIAVLPVRTDYAWCITVSIHRRGWPTSAGDAPGRDGRRPNGLPAANSASIDAASEKGASSGTQDGARRALTLGVDRTSEECTARGTDDQAGRAVRALAAVTALGILPDLSAIARVSHRWRWDDGNDHRRSRGRHENFTH